MGGGTPRADTTNRPTPRSLTPHLRRTRAPLLLPSFLRPPSVIPAQAGTHPPHHPPPPSPIHPSPLPGGRLGGGWNAASRHHQSPHATIAHPASPPHPRPSPPSVIPAPPFRHSCAGRNPPTPPSPTPFPNSSLPPPRGEVRWGVERREPTPPIAPRHDRSPRISAAPAPLSSFRHSCAPLPSFLRLLPSFLRPHPSFLRRQEPRGKGKAATEHQRRAPGADAAACEAAEEPPRSHSPEELGQPQGAEAHQC